MSARAHDHSRATKNHRHTVVGQEALRTLPRRQTRSARFRLASLVLATPSAIHGFGLLRSLSFGRVAEGLL